MDNTSPRSILLLINEKARSGAGAYLRIESELKSAGHKVIELSPEEHTVDYRVLLDKYKDQINLVVVGGGDGSVNYLLPALVKAQVPLIVFPLGTANLLARSFNLKPDISELLNLIKNGKTVSIDLGMVNGIYFINVCGLGISTEVNGNISHKLKKLTGPFSFWLTGLKLSPKLTSYKMKVTVDDRQPMFTRTWQITICNGRKYGAWMTIEPDASYDDQKLHFLSTEITKWWQGFKLLPCYLKGDYKESAELTFLTGKVIKVETKHPLKVDVDGDVQTSTPAVFHVVPRILKLVVPATALHDTSPVSG